jgi:hypothetical protein
MTTLIPKYDLAVTNTVNRPFNLKLNETISVKDFGATGNGTTDDTTAIQNAVDYATSVGGTVFLPKGYYRVTSTINIGLQIYTDYSQATTMITWDLCATNAANKAANFLKKKIDFIGEAETYIVGDFAPAAITPVVAYNLDQNTYEVTGTIANLIIISANQFTGGKLVTSAFDNNKLIGLFVGRGSKVVEKILFFGLGYGLVSLGSYWCAHRDMEATTGGVGFTFNGYNASLATNLNCVVCVTGYRFTGQNGQMSVFGTENCDNDVVIDSADCCIFGPAYLEDVRTTGVTGKYMVKLGTTEDSFEITTSQFTGILTLTDLAGGKNGWRFWGCARVTLDACRFYSAPYDIEALTLGFANGGDGPSEFYRDGTLVEGFSPFIGDSFGNNFTYNIRTGTSTAVGALVTASIHVSWTSLGSAGASDLIITLPYFSKNQASQTYSVSIGTVTGMPLATQLVGVVAPNTNYLKLYNLNNAGAPVVVKGTDCAATGDISLTVTYEGIPFTK